MQVQKTNVDENLFMTSSDEQDVTSGHQTFSKTFNFNENVDKYLIVVKSVSGLLTNTNFNM